MKLKHLDLANIAYSIIVKDAKLKEIYNELISDDKDVTYQYVSSITSSMKKQTIKYCQSNCEEIKSLEISQVRKNISKKHSYVLYLLVIKNKKLAEIHIEVTKKGQDVSYSYLSNIVSLVKKQMKIYCLEYCDKEITIEQKTPPKKQIKSKPKSDVEISDIPEVKIEENVADVADEIVEENEYLKIIKNDLELIKNDENRLPLFPSDLENPYREDLWIGLDDLPIDRKQKEILTVDEVTTSHFSMLRWDNEKPFYFIDVFGQRLYQKNKTMYLCKEAKKGSATRGYVSHHIRAMIENLLKAGVVNDKKGLEKEIDAILRDWEYPIEKVFSRIPCDYLKVKDNPISKMKLRKAEDELSDEEFKKYFSQLNWSAFDEIGRESRLAYRDYAMPRLDLDAKTYDKDVRNKKTNHVDCEEDSAYRNNVEEMQWNFIIDYNGDIASSKLKYLTKRLSEIYSVSETTINKQNSVELLNSLKEII
jgi:hypothetical protein